MSIVLLCEGGEHSPDVIVLRKLLVGSNSIEPEGGKYGMGERIKARREEYRYANVYGILDGDYISESDWETPKDKPHLWINRDESPKFGWRWARKEIENYLLDYEVIRRALGSDAPDKTKYIQLLETARDSVAVYQAARTALSTCRKRLTPLSSSFGYKQRSINYTFPDDLSEDACISGIKGVVTGHNDEQLVEYDEVIDSFNKLLPACQSGGERYRHFLYSFAGKDLLLMMNDGLKKLGFTSAKGFLEKVLTGIRNSTDDIGGWLPEWRALQKAVDGV